MIEQIRLADCNIIFNLNAFDRWHIPHDIGQYKDISTSKGQGTASSKDGHLDRQDAVLEITDELWSSWKAPLWWVFEILPSSYAYEGRKGEWSTTWW